METKSAEVAPLLLARVGGPDPFVRTSAPRALIQRRWPAAPGAGLGRTTRSRADGAVREEAAEAAGKLRMGVLATPLIEALRDDCW